MGESAYKQELEQEIKATQREIAELQASMHDMFADNIKGFCFDDDDY